MTAHFAGVKAGRTIGLLGAFALTSLTAGCSWFDSSSSSKLAPVRPGAETSVPASGLQAAGSGHQYSGDLRPTDESRPIGSVIPDKGGQKAQLDAFAKEEAKHDAEDRDAAAKLDAGPPPPITPASAPAPDAVPPPPNLTGASPAVPPPAPVTSAPVPPPPGSANPEAPASDTKATTAAPPLPPPSAAPAAQP